MKPNRISLALVAALALGFAGCDKKEPPTTTITDDVNKAARSAADVAAKTAEAAKAEAAKVAEAAKAEAAKVAETAKAEAAKTADNARVQAQISKAQSLIAEGKYTEAASILQQLAGQSLSADQTTLVASLKQQIQKALAAKAAGNAAGSVGNLLNK